MCLMIKKHKMLDRVLKWIFEYFQNSRILDIRSQEKGDNISNKLEIGPCLQITNFSLWLEQKI